MFRRLVLVLAAGLLPAVANGSDTSGATAKTRITGRVCAPQGKPLPGITIECFVYDPKRSDDFVWEIGKQVSDEDGRYEFRVESAREYYVSVARGKSTRARSDRIAAPPGAEVTVEDLVVRPLTASLKGRIVKSDGTPAANMEFACRSESLSLFESGEYPRTDENGLFLVPAILPDETIAFWAVPDANQIQLWTEISPQTQSQSLELRVNPREYVEMPPQWRGYADAEAFAGSTVDTKVQKQIDFTLPDLNGRQVSLSSGRFKGKVILVNIFGSWCGGCRIEMPYLVRLQEKYAAQGLEVIGLAFEKEPGEAGLSQLRKLVEEAKVNYPVLLGGSTKPENVCSTIKGIDRFSGYPTTLLLGRDGQVQHVEVGVKAETKARIDWWRNRLEKRVTDLLRNTP